MRVITSNPIRYSSACGCSSSFEGSFSKSNPSHVKEFQSYALSKGAVNVKGKKIGEPLAVDGVWEIIRLTTGKDGSEFTKPTSSPEPTTQQIEEKAKKGEAWDKVKKTWVKAKDSGVLQQGMDIIGGWFGQKESETTPTGTTTTGEEKKGLSTTTKVMIGVGAVAVLGTVIYLVTRKK